MNKRLHDFFFLCECLTPQSDASEILEIERIICEQSVRWERVIEWANLALITPALWSALIHKGLQETVPPDVASYLSELHRLNLARNHAIRQQVSEITTAFNRVGVEPLLLKGAALLFTGALQDPASRMMVDIDILVRTEDLVKVQETLIELHYEPRPDDTVDYDSCPHLPPLVREGDPASIEVHTRLFHDFDDPEVLTTSDVWNGSIPVRVNGLSLRTLSPSHFVIYNVIHSEIHHENFDPARISLRDLLDLTLISRMYAASLDWRDIGARLEKHGLRRVFQSYQYLALKLLGSTVSPGLSPSVPVKCHYWRCLFVLGWPRLQTLFPVGAVRKVFRLFASARMQRRFGCSDSGFDLAKTRVAYSWYLFRNFVVGRKRHMLLARLQGKGADPPGKTASDSSRDGGL